MKTGLESLDTGAPEITYSGNEGPKSPQQIQMMQMAQLEEEYDKYVDEMLEQGLEPMSMQQFLEQIAAEAQMSSNEEGIGSMMEDPREMAAFGGIMRTGFKGGGMDMGSTGSSTGSSGPAGGASSGGNYGGNTGGNTGGNDGGGYNIQDYMTEQTTPEKFTITNQQAQDAINKNEKLKQGIENAKKEKQKQKIAAQIEKERIEKELAKYKKEQEIKETKKFFEKKETKKKKQTFADKLRSKTLAKSLNKKYNLGFDPSDDDFEDKVAKATETVNDPNFDMGLYGISGKDLAVGAKQAEVFGTDGKPNLNISQKDFENVYRPYGQMFIDGQFTPGPMIIPGGGGGGNENVKSTTTPPPGTTPPGSGLPDIPTDFVDLSGTSSYTNPAFAGQYFYGTPTITLANGGRANFAGGGIADLRQGYFLGKLVKKITKPFKKAFRGFKKIAKSPLGRMALLAMGGYYAGGGNLFGLQRAGMSGFKMGNLPGASLFSKTPGAETPIVEGFKNIAKTAFKPENAFSTISGISALSGLYTSYLQNKREDETMAEYQRRLEEERGNFAPIPTDFVQFAANGGRMGFADGGDDDDEDDFRQRALGALYSIRRPEFSIGGSAGMPPVTLQTEGQDIQSFSDDESTGMPQATPTMPNQMPMRPPMMDPRMQQMMAQRANPMMNRGMMSMQQPRIMAQEGGMMDMGGMEKDYRNEGGFVAIGGQERADDVPARLSKNEFVFTADAVRNAGGGDIDKGAEIMENMMEHLEAGGKVSKGSQGLQGAREMFATSQRLEEVL